MKKIRVLIIEDNPFLRDGIEILLNEQPDIKVIKAEADFENAEISLSECRNAVVLLDVSLHNQSRFCLIKKLSSGTLGPVIIVTDVFSIKAETDEYLNAGASGFIDRDATPKEFLNVIRAVAGGAWVLPEQISDSLFSMIVKNAAQSGTVCPNDLAIRITGHEKKIIELVGKGVSNEDIAGKLKISLSKVRCHKDSIMKKLALRKVLSGGE